MISNIDRIIIGILGHHLFRLPMPSLDSVDMEALLTEALHQSVYSIVYSEVADRDLPESFRNLSFSVIANNIRNEHDHYELHKILQDVPYVIIKGMASAYYYPDSIYRQSGDVDFLVSEDDLDRADAILIQNGFHKHSGTSEHGFHWSYSNGSEEAEMHWQAPGIPSVGGDRIRALLADTVQQAVLVQEEQGSFFMPSPFHHGLIILLHTASHLTSGGIGLRHLCDWLVFENSLGDTFTALFEKPLKEIGLWRFAQILTKCGEVSFGLASKSWCDEIDSSLSEDLLEDILTAGNFGRKDEKRSSESKLIRDNGTRKVKKSNTVQNLYQNTVERARNTGLPLPLGIVNVVLQYVGRTLSGKRNNVLDPHIRKEALSRQKLYSQLGLFETE